MRLIRGAEESNADYLYRIYNDMGCTDLALTMTQKTATGICWSSKVRYDVVMDLEDWQYVKGTYYRRYHRPYTKKEFFAGVKHRTILDIEVMFDIDDAHHAFLEDFFPDIESKAKYVYYCLCKLDKEPEVYFTGNKSYHIGFLDLTLRSLSKQGRKKYRDTMLQEFFADLGLASDIRTVALEGVEHYRSEKVKELVVW